MDWVLQASTDWLKEQIERAQQAASGKKRKPPRCRGRVTAPVVQALASQPVSWPVGQGGGQSGQTTLRGFGGAAGATNQEQSHAQVLSSAAEPGASFSDAPPHP